MTVDRTELRRLHAAATPGPWVAIHASRGMVVSEEEIDGRGPVPIYNPEKDADDAALIVAAVNALPVLLDGLDAYQEALKAADWYVECLERVREGRVVRGLDEAKAGFQSLARAALDTEPT